MRFACNRTVAPGLDLSAFLDLASRAGAVAVGLGSWLIGDGDPDGVRARGQRVRAAIDAATGARAPG